MKARNKPRLLSIVAPAYNEEENLVALYERVCGAVEGKACNFELVIVENGSVDRSLEILKELHARDHRVCCLSLSRNFGHQGALSAGVEHSRGDVVVTMDADLQHPPELIPEMLKLWGDGYDIVYTLKREDTAQPWLRKRANRFFYTLLSRLSGLELTGGQSDFRLMDRKAVNALLSLPERSKFLRGLTRWIGFQDISIEYDVPPRFAGQSKFRFGHLLRFAIDGIISFSILPLRLFTFAGMTIAGLAFLYGLFIVIIGAIAFFTGYEGRTPPGWATVGAAVFFLGGMQLIGIGLLGEYIGRVFDEVKGRPIYLVKETVGLSSLEKVGDSAE